MNLKKFLKTSAFRKKLINKKNVIIILFFLVVLLIVFKSAIFNNNNQDETIVQGKALASKHCQSCHMLPDPSLLDKKTWKTLLPEMGFYLGIQSLGVDMIAEQDSDFYPTDPAMNEAEWQSILDYYDAAAPSALPPNKPIPIAKDLPLFSVVPTPQRFVREKMMTSFVQIDTTVKPARVFVYDTGTEQIYLLNPQLQVLDSVFIDGSVVDMSFDKTSKELLVCSIGKQLSMGPDNERIGKVFPLTVNRYGKLEVKPALFENLARPVKIIHADLNGDNRTDIVICEFGKLTGSLTWMENLGKGKYKRRILRNLPGSAEVHIEDNKRNGLPDMWVLFAQGEEGIFHFMNKGNGEFEQKQVLRFPPSYGSTSFEMSDLNRDGFADIIYTCGDNGDGTRILKPYHGVYVFMNDGKNKFKQKYFYPMNGCYKVIARDFKNNGTIDLAAIAYFNDEKHPEEWFVYLKNEGNFKFAALGLPKKTNFERALTMDAGDLNDDGKLDLILGSAFLNKYLYDERPLFMVLKNVGE